MKRTYFALILLLLGVSLFLALSTTEASAGGRPTVTVKGIASQEANPGTQVSYEIEVENRGAHDNFTIELSYDDPDGNWTVSANMSRLEIPADDTKTFMVYVTPHDNDTMPDDEEDLQVTVKVIADGVPNDSSSGIVTTTCQWRRELMLNADMSRKEVDPGEKVSFSLDVWNRGDGEDTFSLDIYDENDTKWEVRSWDSVTLDSNESISVPVNITVKSDASPGSRFFRVEATSDDDESATENSTLEVKVNQKWAVEFSLTSQSRVATPSFEEEDTISFQLELSNTGTETDDFRCEIHQDYTDEGIQSWAKINQGVVVNDLEPGNTAMVQLNVTVKPHYQDHNATAGQKLFWLHVYSKNARDNGQEVDNRTTDLFRATVDVQPYYHVTARDRDSHVPELGPEESSNFRIYVENLGNSLDTVVMVADGDAPSDGEFSNWQSFDEAYLQPATGTNLYMTIKVDGDDKAGNGSYDFYYHAQSQNHSGAISEQEHNSIVVPEYFGVELKLVNSTDSVRPGETAVSGFEVWNTGNSLTDITLVKPDIGLEDWVIYWTNSSTSTQEHVNVRVQAFGMKDMYLMVEVSDDGSKAEAGNYILPVKVKAGSGDDTVQAEDNVTVVVEERYKLELSCPIESSSLKPGENFTYYIELESNSNLWDNVSWMLEESEELGWLSLDEANVTHSTSEDPVGYNSSSGYFSFAPNSSINIPFMVRIPEKAKARQEYDVIVKFTSLGDQEPEFEQELRTRVLLVTDFTIDTEEDLVELTILAEDGAGTWFLMDLSNQGNSEDIFEFELLDHELEEAQENWTMVFRDSEGKELEDGKLGLEAWESDTVNLSVIIDGNTGTGNYYLLVNVSSEEGKENDIIWLSLDITRVKRPVAEIVSMDPNPAQEDQEVEFEGDATVHESVVLYRWESSLDGLLYNGSAANFKVQDLSIGNHSITLMVKDNYGLWSVEAEDTLLVTMIPKQNKRPIVTLSSPNNHSTLSGLVLVAGSAQDQDGSVSKLEIRVDNGDWLAPDGMENLTGTWFWTLIWNSSEVLDGNHTITARAYDGELYSAEVFVEVVVDNSDDGGGDGEEGEDEIGFLPSIGAPLVMVSLVMAGALATFFRRH